MISAKFHEADATEKVTNYASSFIFYQQIQLLSSDTIDSIPPKVYTTNISIVPEGKYDV